MRLRIYCLLAALWPVLICYSQFRPKAIRSLTIGDTIPADLELHDINNYPVSKIRISDLRGKLVIIDFAATWCGSCIKDLLHFITLKKEYDKRIEIFFVSREPIASLKHFNQRRPEPDKITLPAIFQDTILSALFPHRLLPHKIWIGPDGQVKQITDSKELTSSNVQRILKGELLKLPLKKDLVDFDDKQPLLTNLAELQQSSINLNVGLLSYEIEGVAGKSRIDRKDDSIRMLFLNQPLESLYRVALGLSAIDKSIITWSIKEPSDMYDIRSEKFCYEIKRPALITIQNIKTMMLDDLNQYFGLEVKKSIHNGETSYQIQTHIDN